MGASERNRVDTEEKAVTFRSIAGFQGTTMLANFRLALRSLAHSRGFALTAILTLAVGIGGTTAIFSALQALVLQPFSYPQADRLAHVWSGDGWSLSPADSLDVRQQSTSFESFGFYQPESYNVGSENA